MIAVIGGIILIITIVSSLFVIGVELYEKALNELHREDD